MMKSAEAMAIDLPTRDSSGKPRPHELGEGITLVLPSWQSFDADGNPFEGVGNQPDVRVERGAAEDIVLAEEIEQLRKP